MKNKLFYLFLIIFSTTFFLNACSAGGSKEVAKEFYKALKVKDYEKALSYCSAQAFESTPKKRWLILFKQTQFKLGALQSYESQGFNTSYNDGLTKTSFNFKVQYEKEVRYELLEFIENDGQYEILLYKVSDEPHNPYEKEN